eukprot:TRINITY_DN8263_c0_g1_i2.p1 TRINITY_DN8263_c0_g1~~TRINITY_DN8263_c0_g1_i2.p1  ORF type:complete len:849 (-),score=165.35 TRINITY_DN8263_c0_g1_i2:939-3485(-)
MSNPAGRSRIPPPKDRKPATVAPRQKIRPPPRTLDSHDSDAGSPITFPLRPAAVPKLQLRKGLLQRANSIHGLNSRDSSPPASERASRTVSPLPQRGAVSDRTNHVLSPGRPQRGRTLSPQPPPQRGALAVERISKTLSPAAPANRGRTSPMPPRTSSPFLSPPTARERRPRSSLSARSTRSAQSSVSMIKTKSETSMTPTEVQVIARVRPVGSEMKRCLRVDTEAQSVVLRPAAERQSERVFTFDWVADESSTQDQVFEKIGHDMVSTCLSGTHGTVFAYGQTGSGKTHTMQGPTESAENPNRGLIPRILAELFESIAEDRERDYTCRVTFVEIYNDLITDLLSPSQALHLREDGARGVFVDGALEETVVSAADAYQLLLIGSRSRHIASTSMNRASSRSHSVFTVAVESRRSDDVVMKYARLNLVDLAGSERQHDTLTEGKTLKEAGRINRSLSALGNVILALCDIAAGRTRHIHFRDSKLTYLLKDSLGGNTRTCMIATVSPTLSCMAETLSTLKFAQRAKQIKNRVTVNEDVLWGGVDELQAEVRRLRGELSKAQLIIERLKVAPLPTSLPQMLAIAEAVPVVSAAELEPASRVQSPSLSTRSSMSNVFPPRPSGDEDDGIFTREPSPPAVPQVSAIPMMAVLPPSPQPVSQSPKPTKAAADEQLLKYIQEQNEQSERYRDRIRQLESLLLKAMNRIKSTEAGHAAALERGDGFQKLLGDQQNALEKVQNLMKLRDGQLKRATGGRGCECGDLELRAELAMLKEYVSRHPDVTRLTNENAELNEIVRVQDERASQLQLLTQMNAELSEQLRVQLDVNHAQADKLAELESMVESGTKLSASPIPS